MDPTSPPPHTPAAGGRRRTARRLDTALTLLLVAVATTWALLTPPLHAPDEPQHLSSVLRIAYGGGWPEPGDAALAPALVVARDDVALGTDLPGRYADRADVPQFAEADIVPGERRARVDAATALAPGPADDADDVDQMTQHPPLYYALGAGVLHVTGLADARWDHQLLAIRLLDVALLAPLVPLASWSARRLTGSVAAGAVAGTFPLVVPQAGHILGSATNDALVTLVGAVATALAVRVLAGDRRLRTAALLGAVVGVGLLTKVMAMFLVPMVVAAYLLGRGGTWGAPGGIAGVRRLAVARADAVRVALAGLVALGVGGWWWVRNLVVHGTVQPGGMAERDLGSVVPDGPVTYVVAAWRRLARSFFADLGWLELRSPQAFWLTATVVLLALGGVALTARATWRPVATLLAAPTALTVGVLANGWGYYQEHGLLVGHQGRYLFAGLAGLGVVVAIALRRLVGGVERRLEAVVPGAVVVGVAVTCGGLVFALRGFYQPDGWSLAQALERWALLSPVGAGWLVAAVAVGAASALAALAMTVRPRWRRTPPRGVRGRLRLRPMRAR